LEAAIAAFLGTEDCILYSSCFDANGGLFETLLGEDDAVVSDELNHASIIDGIRLCKARRYRYRNNDMADLETRLREADAAGARFKLIATDGVFSMDGDLAPLPALAAATRRHGAWLVVDDAHGLGVLGKEGRGSVEHFGLDTNDVPLLIGTLGKAFGTCGAFVAGEVEVIEYLLQSCRTYRYTTAPPQALAAATLAALRVASRDRWRRERVLALTQRFRSAAARAGIALGDSPTPIQPLQLGDAGRALAVSRSLLHRGYWVTAIRPPTVPAGTARLRVALSAAHTEAQVDGLVTALAESLAESPTHRTAEGAPPRRPAPISA